MQITFQKRKKKKKKRPREYQIETKLCLITHTFYNENKCMKLIPKERLSGPKQNSSRLSDLGSTKYVIKIHSGRLESKNTPVQCNK
jgi:hypothetical protein